VRPVNIPAPRFDRPHQPNPPHPSHLATLMPG
jgi:hypothetical protein